MLKWKKVMDYFSPDALMFCNRKTEALPLCRAFAQKRFACFPLSQGLSCSPESRRAAHKSEPIPEDGRRTFRSTPAQHWRQHSF